MQKSAGFEEFNKAFAVVPERVFHDRYDRAIKAYFPVSADGYQAYFEFGVESGSVFFTVRRAVRPWEDDGRFSALVFQAAPPYVFEDIARRVNE